MRTKQLDPPAAPAPGPLVPHDPSRDCSGVCLPGLFKAPLCGFCLCCAACARALDYVVEGSACPGCKL